MKYTKNEKSLTKDVYNMLQKEFDYDDRVKITLSESNKIIIEDKISYLLLLDGKKIWEFEQGIRRIFENVSIFTYPDVKDGQVVFIMHCVKQSARK